MSALEYMQYIGFGSANAGIMVIVDQFMFKVGFAFIALTYCAFAIQTMYEDTHE